MEEIESPLPHPPNDDHHHRMPTSKHKISVNPFSSIKAKSNSSLFDIASGKFKERSTFNKIHNKISHFKPQEEEISKSSSPLNLAGGRNYTSESFIV
jgi:hypothetical protein